jgi:(2R)-sulfolactate sulfo-lyase subunit alpha
MSADEGRLRQGANLIRQKSKHRAAAETPLNRGRAVAKVPHFLVHSPKDNVGVVVVEGLKAGTTMLGVITENDTTIELVARQDIPIGHKIALRELRAGDTVIKYGEDVGRMVADARAGDHVHVHNLKTKRW